MFIYKALKNIFVNPEKYKKIFLEVMESEKITALFIETQQARLAYSGETIYGKPIETKKAADGFPYARSTVRRKKAKNRPYNIVTLKDTGQFYSTMDLLFDGFIMSFDAFFGKQDGNILDNFDKEFTPSTLLGVTDEEFNYILREAIFPFFILRLNAYFSAQISRIS